MPGEVVGASRVFIHWSDGATAPSGHCVHYSGASFAPSLLAEHWPMEFWPREGRSILLHNTIIAYFK